MSQTAEEAFYLRLSKSSCYDQNFWKFLKFTSTRSERLSICIVFFCIIFLVSLFFYL